jgi:hypothetical protein
MISSVSEPAASRGRLPADPSADEEAGWPITAWAPANVSLVTSSSAPAYSIDTESRALSPAPRGHSGIRVKTLFAATGASTLRRNRARPCQRELARPENS